MNDTPHAGRSLLVLVLLPLLAALATFGCGPERPPSLLLITIDTARADVFGCYGGRAHTPTFDALAREGTIFTQALTPVPITHPAHASLFTGLYPERHGVRDNGLYTLDESASTLAELLRDRGYDTAAFVSAVVLTRTFGLAQGFAHYDDTSLSATHVERSAGETVAAAVARLAQAAPVRPFFYWVHVYDPHFPYQPPEPWASQFRDAPYLGEVSYADAELGRLIAEARRVDPRTVVTVTADHGEGLGEHGEATHGIFLYQSTMHVPLVIAGDSVPRGQRVDRLLSLVDVMPTLCALAQADAPPGIDGESLLTGSGRVTALATAEVDHGEREVLLETMLPYLSYGWSALHGLARGGMKTIAAPRPELYDLGLDPHEQTNLAGARSDELVRRLALLQARRAGLVPLAVRPLSASQRVEGALSSLGYVSTPRRIDGRETAGPDPKDMVALLDLEAQAKFLMERADWQGASSILERILERNPENAIVNEMLGASLTRLGQYERARTLLEQVIAQRPDRPMAVFHLALANEMTGRVDRARELYESTLALDGSHAQAHVRLANILWAQDRKDDAREHYRRYLALEPGDPTREAAVRERLASK